MKKSKIKWEIRQAMVGYYKKGLTNTAANVLEEINERIDKLYNKK